MPRWLIGLFPTAFDAAVACGYLCRAISVLGASLPFAWLITRITPRLSLPIALFTALAAWGALEAPLLAMVLKLGARFKIAYFVYSFEIIAVLPLLAFLLRITPSNKRLERTRLGQSV